MATTDGHLRLGPDCARLVVRTRREGLAARVGHDLTIEVTRWSAEVELPGGDPAGARITARIGLDSLAVREASGGALPLTDADRREIERNARRTLVTDRHPDAAFESTRVTPTEDGGVIDGTLTLLGNPAPVRLTVTRVAPDRYRAVAPVVQSAYGIRPYSAFFGALRLRDEVTVELEFTVDASPPPG